MKKISIMLALLCVTTFAQQKGTFTDPRDDKIYKIVKIGTQTWMAENLNYATSNSKCYKNEILYCDRYGRLYDWETAMIVCPKGWHLPSDAEWGVLVAAVGGRATAGKYLKAKSGWNDYYGESGNGTDAYGFAALAGGQWASASNVKGYEYFDLVGKYGLWWSASDGNETNRASCYGMSHSWETTSRYQNYKDDLLNVRCVRD